MPARLRPSAPIAPDAVLVGDPGRALLLAQELLERPKMSNHARGLWGYTARTPAGRELTVQSTGIGGPSAAAVLADLAELGLRRAVRVGTCAALEEGLAPGDLLIVAEALPADGVSRSLAGEGPVAPDPGLLAALADAGRLGTVESGDLSRALLAVLSSGWAAAPPAAGGGGSAGRPLAHDLQTAALLALAPRLGVAAAALLIVAEAAGGERIDDGALEEAAKRAGAAASGALSA